MFPAEKLSQKEQIKFDETIKKIKNKDINESSVSNNIENNSEANIENNKPTYAKIGDEISIEHFMYRVNGVRYAKSVGNEFMKQTADGIYLIIDLSLKNLDKEEHTIDNSMYKLTDENGTEFESSTDANTALEMDGKETLFLKQCNPKIQKKGLLVFEVPEKGIYDLHLSGGFWSGRTTVVKLIDK